MKVLVAGANGQLGRTLADTAPQGVVLHLLDLPNLDITDEASVRRHVNRAAPDLIVNAAAYTAVDRAEEQSDLAFAVNAAGAGHLARAARETDARLIHVSTDYVFDGGANTPYAPEAECRPLGVYGESKRQGEIAVLEALENALILRTAWLYSRYGANFVLTMLRLMDEREQLSVVADQVGTPTWTGTLAVAVWAAAARPEISGVYHWTDAGVGSWYDFAVAIQEEAVTLGKLARPIPIAPIRTADYPTSARRPAYSVLDCTRSWRDLEVTPIHWREALRRMLRGGLVIGH
ncbi:MAG: dTDP-4-dehydrorhamnose reductase [Desulfosarcinaceae bacterium]|jgi:dTDP-4-dehydrorhamnose reductase